MKRRLFFIAGEASGDVYGAYLIRLLKENDSELEIWAIGGDKMKSEGAIIIHHIRELSVMGFVEVFKNLNQIRSIFKSSQSHILKEKTETIILIDFPGFNLRMAKWAKSHGIRTIQYISPKVWAWNESRISKIKKYIDTLICVFPFEVQYYQTFNIVAHYFGNPLYKIIESHVPGKPNIVSDKAIIGLMPGSRKQEIKRILPLLLEFSSEFENYHFLVGGMSLIGESFYRQIMQNTSANVTLLMDRNYDILSKSDIIINTSGTITLESLLFQKPQIVVYATHPMSYYIIRRLIKLDYISLPNILADAEIVPELIQDNLTVHHLKKEFDRIQATGYNTDYEQVAETLYPKCEEKLVSLIIGE